MLLAAGRAAAGEVSDETLNYRVNLPAGWRVTELPEGGGTDEVVAMWTRDDTDQVAVISKIVGPTDGADKGEAAFYESVEAGVKKHFPTYRRLSSKKHQLGKGKKKTPAYDLWFRTDRNGRQVVLGARFLFFRGYTLGLVIDQPGARRAGSAAKRLLESFVPAK